MKKNYALDANAMRFFRVFRGPRPTRRPSVNPSVRFFFSDSLSLVLFFDGLVVFFILVCVLRACMTIDIGLGVMFMFLTKN